MKCELPRDVNKCPFFNEEKTECSNKNTCSFQAEENSENSNNGEYVRKERWYEKYYKK